MEYKERLKKFNSTQKYQDELEFLSTYLKVGTGLDFGCGIGTAVNYFNSETDVYFEGYDITPYNNWYITQLQPAHKFDYVTFIHSLAHIENVELTLHKLKDNLTPNGRIVVITPNQDWINIVGDTKSDPTVVRHFTNTTLKDLFVNYKIVEQGQFGEQKGDQKERLYIICE